MNIPPLLSRTPPPLYDSESNDNEDGDFGSFAMCSVIGRDDEYQSIGKTVSVEDSNSEDSGLCTGSSMGQAHSPYETSPKTGIKGLSNGEDHLFNLSLPNTDQEHQQLPHQSICDGENVGEIDGDAQSEDITSIDDVIDIGAGQSTSIDSLPLSEIPPPPHPESPELEIFKTATHDFVNKSEEVIEDDQGDFEDFQVFEGLETNQMNRLTTEDVVSTNSYPPHFEKDSVNDISSETSSNVQEDWDQENSKQLKSVENSDVTDELDEFSEFQASSFLPPPAVEQSDPKNQEFLSPFHPSHFSQTDVNVENLSNLNEGTVVTPDLQDLVCQNVVWLHLHSLEDTPALRYQWASSTSNRKFLSALKIDSRNILCSLWNKSAKTTGQDSCSSSDLLKLGSDCKDPTVNHGVPIHKNVVPDAHFDWVGSGLTNPLDSCSNDGCVASIAELDLGHTKISQQAEEILSSLPDRSYLKKTYIVFKKVP